MILREALHEALHKALHTEALHEALHEALRTEALHEALRETLYEGSASGPRYIPDRLYTCLCQVYPLYSHLNFYLSFLPYILPT